MPRNMKSAWRLSITTWRSSSFGASLSPGNEQREYWGSKAADEEGSRNLLGVKSPVIDELIEELIRSPDRASLIAHTSALDRVLQYGYYLIPNYHLSAFRVAYWDKFRRPKLSPKYGIGLDTWWVDPKAEQAIEAKKGEVGEVTLSPRNVTTLSRNAGEG